MPIDPATLTQLQSISASLHGNLTQFDAIIASQNVPSPIVVTGAPPLIQAEIDAGLIDTVFFDGAADFDFVCVRQKLGLNGIIRT